MAVLRCEVEARRKGYLVKGVERDEDAAIVEEDERH
jgi:hypothetical protein